MAQCRLAALSPSCVLGVQACVVKAGVVFCTYVDMSHKPKPHKQMRTLAHSPMHAYLHRERERERERERDLQRDMDIDVNFDSDMLIGL